MINFAYFEYFYLWSFFFYIYTNFEISERYIPLVSTGISLVYDGTELTYPMSNIITYIFNLYLISKMGNVILRGWTRQHLNINACSISSWSKIRRTIPIYLYRWSYYLFRYIFESYTSILFLLHIRWFKFYRMINSSENVQWNTSGNSKEIVCSEKPPTSRYYLRGNQNKIFDE